MSKRKPKVSYKENFAPRGIGRGWIECFVCANPEDSKANKNEQLAGPLQADMASFVENKKAGERVVAMFALEGAGATLDYRPSEPSWVQVKVGACEEHEANLQKLHELTAEDLCVTPGIIRAAMALEAPTLPQE